MSSQGQGAVEFTLGDRVYRLHFTIDAICQLEQACGKGIVAITADLQNPVTMSLTFVRAALWAGLLEHQSGISLKAAGEMILPLGGALEVVKLLQRAIGAAFPKPARPTPARTRTRNRGTGSASTETGSVSGETASNSGN